MEQAVAPGTIPAAANFAFSTRSSPDSSLSNRINEVGVRVEMAPDYVLRSETATEGLQFVMNNEPHLPRTCEDKKFVRSNAMRKARAIQKKRNNMPAQRRHILQKGISQTGSPSNFNTVNTSPATTPSANNSLSPYSPKTQLADLLSSGSEHEVCLTPDSNYPASDERLSLSHSVSADSEIETTESKAETRIAPASFKVDMQIFDRWIFDTSKSMHLPSSTVPDWNTSGSIRALSR